MSVKTTLSKTYLSNKKYTPDANTQAQWKRNPAWLPPPKIMRPKSGFTLGVLNGSVRMTAVQSDGKIVAVGDFTTYAGVSSPYIVRINTDGTRDSSLLAGTGFDLYPSIVKIQSDGKIIVAGQFTSYNGTSCNRIVRLNTDGSIDSSFVIGTGFGALVTAIAVQSDGKILVGGDFTSYNVTSCNRIIRLNSDGSADTTFVTNIGTGLDSFVNSFAVQSDGKIIVGGTFTTFNGNSRNGLVRINSSGTIDSSFTVGTGFNASSQINTLGLQSDGKIIAGGDFTSYQGVTRRYLLRLNTDGSFDSNFYTSTGVGFGLSSLPYTLGVFSDDRLVIGGGHVNFDGFTRAATLTGLTAFGYMDPGFHTAFGTNYGPDNTVAHINIVDDNNIIIAGYFLNYQGVAQKSLAYLSNTDIEGAVVLKAIPTAKTSAFQVSPYSPPWKATITTGGTIGTLAYVDYYFNVSSIPTTQFAENIPGTKGNYGAPSSPVIFTDAGDLVTRNSHGYSDGDTVTFYSITNTTGITVETPYYVINSTKNTFQLSTTPAGSVIALTNDGSGTLLPYAQVYMYIYPQSGSTMTTLLLNQTAGLETGFGTRETGYLEIRANIPNITNPSNFGIGTGAIGGTPRNVGMRMLEQVIIKNCTLNDISYMFYECSNLESVPLFDTSNATNAISAFSFCHSIASIPSIDTSNVTSLNSMFSDCNRLQIVPPLNTAKVTDMGGMFNTCTSLQSVPLFNTAKVTSMSTMFTNCYSLKTVPLFNTVSVAGMTSMFSGCNSLESVPLFNTVNVTAMNNMFYFCQSLQTVPQFNTANVNNMSLMFGNCYKLEHVPLFNTANVISTNQMFNGCRSLKTVPLFDTSKVTDMGSMFQGCQSLQRIPNLNTSLVTNIGQMMLECYSLLEMPPFDLANVTTISNFISISVNGQQNLSRSAVTGVKINHDYSNNRLGAGALNEIYNRLATLTMATAQTITVTGNWGTAIDSPAIATAKFWTVTG